MKLTKARLKQIIKEQIKVLDRYGNPLKPLRDWEFELKDGSYNEKFKHAEGWALARAHYKGLVPDGVDTSDDNIKTVKNPMRSGAKRTSESKLTKARLKRMIKEELTRTLKESASSKDEWLKILNSLGLEPDTPIEKYADELVDNEVTISDFDTGLQGYRGALIWTDLLELGISKRNAQAIEQFALTAAEWDPYRYDDTALTGPPERRLRADDLKAAKEILKRRIGGYSGTALPGGKRIK